jgi:hypothetical protein
VFGLSLSFGVVALGDSDSWTRSIIPTVLVPVKIVFVSLDDSILRLACSCFILGSDLVTGTLEPKLLGCAASVLLDDSASVLDDVISTIVSFLDQILLQYRWSTPAKGSSRSRKSYVLGRSKNQNVQEFILNPRCETVAGAGPGLLGILLNSLIHIITF